MSFDRNSNTTLYGMKTKSRPAEHKPDLNFPCRIVIFINPDVLIDQVTQVCAGIAKRTKRQLVTLSGQSS